MKRAIVKRMIFILVVALAVSGIISGYCCYQIFESEITNEMRNILYVLDQSIKRDQNLGEQVETYQEALEDNYRITIIDMEGNVLADSQTKDVASMENHNDRKEVKEAMIKGHGYESRTSDTIGVSMVYVAYRSTKNNDIIRLSIETATARKIIRNGLGIFAISFAMAFTLALFIIRHLANSITKPLKEIAEKLSEFDGEKKEFHFKTYAYEELNIIAETTGTLSKNVKDYLERLEKEKQVRQEFFSNASHELKTPLTAIRGYTELMQSGMAIDESVRNDFLSRIHKEAKGMSELVNDILMISRLETKETTPTMSNIRVYLVAEDAVNALLPMAEEAGVEIQMNCAPLEVYMSRKHLEELITNLVSNAIKYNKPDGSVVLTIKKESENLIIQVEDNGMGISPEDKERIFERFYRVDKGRSKRIGGSGLGLSIVKHIVEYYGGTVVVMSELGHGSRFVVQLPILGEMQEEAL